MPQKTVKNFKKGEISFLADGSYDSIHSSILRVVGKDAPFASTLISGNSVMWMTDTNDKYTSITNAPEELQGVLGLMWEQLKKDLYPRLKSRGIEYVLTIPDMSFVFYTEKNSGEDSSMEHRFKLLITGWACKFSALKDDTGDDSLRKRIFEASNMHQNVIVKMLGVDGEPLSGKSFSYRYNNTAECDKVSDSNGVINQGICVVGSTLYYTYKETNQTCSIKVQKNIEEYTIVFAPQVKVELNVVNQYDEPMPALNVDFDYGNVHYSLKTDGRGYVAIDELLYTDQNLLISVNIPEYNVSETYRVENPLTSIAIVVTVPERIERFLQILMDDQPIEGYSIKFSGDVNGIYASDNTGMISLSKLVAGSKFTAESIHNGIIKDYVVEEGKNTYIFAVSSPKGFACKLKFIKERSLDPIEGVAAEIKYGESLLSKISDINGEVVLDDMFAGTVLEVLPEGLQSPITVTIEEGKYEYIIKLPEPVTVDCYLKVVRGVNLVPVQNFFVDIHGAQLSGGKFTDMNGIIPLGNLVVGAELDILPDGLTDAKQIIVEEGKSEYLIILPDLGPVTKDCHIKVIGGADLLPVPDYRLGVKSTTINGMFTTDSYGIIPLPGMVLGDNLVVFLNETNEPQTFEITEEKDEYIVYLGQPENLQDCHIKVVTGTEFEPVPNFTLRIESDTVQGFFNTDMDGRIPLGEQKPGTVFNCYTDLENPPVNIIIEEGKDEYLIKIDEIPGKCVGDIVVTLLEKDKKTPLTPATMTIINGKKEEFTSDNDQNGNIIVPRSFFTHNENFKVISKSPKYSSIKPCKVTFDEKVDHYFIWLTDPFNWKLLLWLLIFPLLFLVSLINFHKDVTVHVDDGNGNGAPGVNVAMDYTEHALYKNGEFFYEKEHHYNEVTDSNGDCVFENVPNSVYSCIFYCFKKAEIKVGNQSLGSGTQSVKANGFHSNSYGIQSVGNTSKKILINWKKKVNMTYQKPVPPQPVPPKVEMYDLLFRTVDAKTYNLLPDCDLHIQTSKSNVSSPTNSGKGEFMVYGLYPDETISIVAQKKGFGVNDITIKNVLVEELISAEQSRRDIPLGKEFQPCNAGANGESNVAAGTVSVPQMYNMGVDSGVFDIVYETGSSCADQIDIYNHKPNEIYSKGVKIFSSGMVVTNTHVHKSVQFNNGSCITVIVTTGKDDGSLWNYHISCPK